MSYKAILIIAAVVIVVMFTASVALLWKIKQLMFDLRIDVMKTLDLREPEEVPVPNDPKLFIEESNTEEKSEEVDTNEIDSYSV